MGKKSKAPMPAAPDYTALANQQAEASKKAIQEQTLANRPTQIGTEGSMTWTQDPTTGAWTQTSQLNQPQQDLYNTQLGNRQQLSNLAGSMLGNYDTSQVDFSKAPALPGISDYGAVPGQADYSKAPSMPGVSDYSSLTDIPGQVDYSSLGSIPQVGQYNQQATDLYRQLGQPDLDRAQAARRAALAARGISDVTSQAGTNMEAQLADQSNRFAMEAALRGIQQGNVMFGQGMQGYQQGAQNLNNNWQQAMAGRQQGVNEMNTQFNQGLGLRQQGVGEQNTLWGQGMQGYQQNANNLNNQFTQGMGLHQQGVNDILNQRNSNMGQLQGLMGLAGNQSPNPSFAGFSGSGMAQTPDLMGASQAQYQAAVNQANAKNASKGGLLGTIGGIAGTALGGPLGGAIGSGIGGLFGGGGGGGGLMGNLGTAFNYGTSPFSQQTNMLNAQDQAFR